MVRKKYLSILISLLFFFIKVSYSSPEDSDMMDYLNDPIVKNYLAEKKQLNEGKANLAAARQNLDTERKHFAASKETTDIIRLNIGGEIMVTTRLTLTRVSKSLLHTLFKGTWEEKLSTDDDGNIFLDFNPTLFRYLLEQLRTIKDDHSLMAYPSKSLQYPSRIFQRMLKKLHLSPTEPPSVGLVALNVGGQSMLTQYKTLTQIPQSRLASFISEGTVKKSVVFIDHDPDLFRHLMKQLRGMNNVVPYYFKTPSMTNQIEFNRMLKDFQMSPMTTTTTTTTSTSTTTSTTTRYTVPPKLVDRICDLATWDTNGITVAGGNGAGSKPNQLSSPRGIFMDIDNHVLYIADSGNNRIVKWFVGAMMGQVVAGIGGPGLLKDQLYRPSDIAVNKNGTMYICDSSNRRIQRWLPDSLQGDTILNIACTGLALDNEESLYVTDVTNNRVIKWPGEQVVAGGKGRGARLDQLDYPEDIFVDDMKTVYVVDKNNSRIVKWSKGAETGVIEVITMKIGTTTHTFNTPNNILLDRANTIYVSHSQSNKISRTTKRHRKPVFILDGSVKDRNKALNFPADLAFDRHGNLYVCDLANHRIQMFTIDLQHCQPGSCQVG